MKGGKGKEEGTAQPPTEQPVHVEVFRDLTTGGRVNVVVQVPDEQWFRTCKVGDEMPCAVLRVVDTQDRT